jgi:hypothetical protein
MGKKGQKNGRHGEKLSVDEGKKLQINGSYGKKAEV